MKIILATFLFFLTSCGFKPMYSKDTLKNYYFEEIKLIGNKSINQKLTNSGILIEDSKIQNNKKLIIKSKLTILETSKNSEGLVQTYRSILDTNFTFLENEKIIKNKSFNKSFSYPTKDNRFELLEYQNTVEKNLTSEIIKDIIIFLNINDN
tara:strand:+ start:745 stop:1200 length:456 start_codon:yes stop_codon:yes gene_type:complete